MKVRECIIGAVVGYCIYFLILYLSARHASRVLQQISDE